MPPRALQCRARRASRASHGLCQNASSRRFGGGARIATAEIAWDPWQRLGRDAARSVGTCLACSEPILRRHPRCRRTMHQAGARSRSFHGKWAPPSQGPATVAFWDSAPPRRARIERQWQPRLRQRNLARVLGGMGLGGDWGMGLGEMELGEMGLGGHGNLGKGSWGRLVPSAPCERAPVRPCAGVRRRQPQGCAAMPRRPRPANQPRSNGGQPPPGPMPVPGSRRKWPATAPPKFPCHEDTRRRCPCPAKCAAVAARTTRAASAGAITTGT
jgi:hypothetical protein